MTATTSTVRARTVDVQRDLVLKAAAGDRDAFTTLAVAAHPRLHRTARLILRDDERASDAVQETLVAAWTDLRALRDHDRFESWLTRILVHACYAEARRYRRRSAIELPALVVDLPIAADPPTDVAVREELEHAFARLGPPMRAVLVLHHYLGLRDAEAAAALDIPVGTFKSRLHRATHELRSALEAEARHVLKVEPVP